MRHLSLLMFSALAFAGSVGAAPITINNHSFEADFAAPNTFPVGFAPTGWQAYNPFSMPINSNESALGILNPTGSTFFPAGAPDGSKVALVWLNDGEGAGNHNPLGISQTLGVGLTPNTHYTLNVDVGNIDSGTGATPPFNVFFNIKGFPGYAVQLLAGGTLLAEDNNGLGGSLAEGVFATSTIEFITGASVAAGLLEIRLINLNQLGTVAEPGIEVDFDNVRLDATPVPVPPTVWLFGSALAGLLGVRRRR
ncbi:MAG: PEP-CTERM sorting domain-containing protein [Candidatus Methylumidiphilus sp.]